MFTPTDYSNEPVRSKLLIVNAKEPFNAEAPVRLLRDAGIITPNELFLKRNHAPIPDIDASRYFLEVNGLVREPLRLTMNDIYQFPMKSIVATVLCAGNRRTDMAKVKKVIGVGWGAGALSTAMWEGASLRDVLLRAGVSPDVGGSLHVEFEGWDAPKEEAAGTGYTVSCSLHKAMDLMSDVILAYRMNNQTIPRDHGYPLRCVVPGYIGARSVKWLKRITVIPHESKGFFQYKDYKLFTAQIDPQTADRDGWWDKAPPITEVNIQSVICDPIDGQAIPLGQPLLIRGYAFSGGGRRIIRVDVSFDDTKTWQVAEILPYPTQTSPEKCWAWVFWQLRVDDTTQLFNNPGVATIICRAFDSSSNAQPENISSIWNFRGVLNNAYHRINVKPGAKL